MQDFVRYQSLIRFCVQLSVALTHLGKVSSFGQNAPSRTKGRILRKQPGKRHRRILMADRSSETKATPPSATSSDWHARRTGRPATGKTRGTWAGSSRNSRKQGECVLRRDPSAQEKLSMLNMLQSKIDLPGDDDLLRQAPTSTRRWFEAVAIVIN